MIQLSPWLIRDRNTLYISSIVDGHLKGVPMVGDQKTGGTIAWRQA